MDFVSVELAGLFYGRIQTKVGIKLLWGGMKCYTKVVTGVANEI